MNKENNNLIAEFMGAVCKMVDHTDGNEDYCRQEGLDKWIIPTWTKPEGYNDEWGWGKYSLGLWEYDKKWDWLMPIVEKIENYSTPHYWNFDKCTESDYCCSVTIESDMTIITVHYKQPDQSKQRKCKSFTCKAKTKIEAVYNAVVKFIKWYNKENGYTQ